MTDPQQTVAHPICPDEGDHTVHGYMCLVDFECELGAAEGGNRIFPSVENLRKHKKCVDGCGIVKVAIRALEIVQGPKMELNDHD